MYYSMVKLTFGVILVTRFKKKKITCPFSVFCNFTEHGS